MKSVSKEMIYTCFSLAVSYERSLKYALNTNILLIFLIKNISKQVKV
ncbi:hypothetical protein FHS90_001971 [Rufibacter quisquiliarum]|uniref:Uncharacterized protein n=1 Tax=Rufibacter quisquiliarum TaxID=1549639 RepID=A0A839GFG1_9BACT|nr:hypothetical protein [Rufibacter quisquiliarum]